MGIFRKFLPTRRQVVLGGIVTGGVAAGGGIYAAAADRSEFFKAMISDALPGVTFDPTAFQEFTVEMRKNRNPDFDTKLQLLASLNRVTGYGSIKQALKNSWNYEKFRREMLTSFLIGSNFFQVKDPMAEPIKYLTYPVACTNPFARTTSS